ncbi:transient receptor potential-gamma protein-like [Planococcus citri]|uniref:transient receptor potential-gamma protein-like n=1 Tax=Planococcus citri TaxID=170843 RepID=UPI0031F8C223
MNDTEKKRLSFTLSVPKIAEKQVKRHSIHGITEEIDIVKPHQEIGHLSTAEKQYLLAVERGDVTTVHNFLMQNKADEILGKPQHERTLNINCVDPLGRSAIFMAIDNENYEMLKLLVDHNVETKDALLYAISEEFVEAVELLLNYLEKNRKPGDPHSWEQHSQDTNMFTPDITPLILAAHRDNYEIIKIILDRGARLPIPHDNRCSCYDCIESRSTDSLQYSHSRLNAYKALSSPCLIALSSKDPVLTAFELSWALRKLSIEEHEFKADYEELRYKCQNFATDLLDHTRTSGELEILLNYDTKMDFKETDKVMHLARLKLAIKLKQKEFVVHPNVQQLLASIWYEGLPGFRQKHSLLQALECLKIGLMFPIFSAIYILTPCPSVRRLLKTPFIKFICHSAAYFLFLFLIILTSFEPIIQGYKKYLMYLIGAFVLGLLWNEIKSLWTDGYTEYVSDMWNSMDYVTTSLYLCVMAIRIFLTATEKGRQAWDTKRIHYDKYHPTVVSEALFSTANIVSILKLVYIFSINPYLGPLQIVLGRVILDIAKFFLVYVLVLFAFSNGMHHLLVKYSNITMNACINSTEKNDGDIKLYDSDMCKNKEYWKFINLFEITQTLFWAAFGDIDLKRFNLEKITPFTKFWGMLMFGCYCVISIVVLLNLLIAMMNHSYEYIFKHADIEWKFARSKLWISYFEEGGTVPVPFNIIPSPKSFWYVFRWNYRKCCPKRKEDEFRSKSVYMRQMSLNQVRYRNVIKNLVQRYVTSRQKRGGDHYGVTEDDINELKQEISTFRSDLYEILRNYGMKTNPLGDSSSGAISRKIRSKQRLFNTEFSQSISDSVDLSEAELERQVQNDRDERKAYEGKYALSDLFQPIFHATAPINIFNKKKFKNVFMKAVSKGNDFGDEPDSESDYAKTPEFEQAEKSEINEDREVSPQVEICISDEDGNVEENDTSIKFIDESLH